MVDTVDIEANYDKAKEVPHIGQRKHMRVNGRIQIMTLNHLEVRRCHAWADDGYSHEWWFNSKETWGSYLYPAR